jgi:uncharacterized membrane protein
LKGNKLVLGLLALSLAMNLGFVGFVIGKNVRDQESFGPPVTHKLPRWTNDLSEQRRSALQPMLRQQRLNARAQTREIRRAYAAVHADIGAEEFSKTELIDSLAQLRTQLVASQNASHEDLINFVSALRAGERKLLARHLQKQNTRRRSPQGLPELHAPRHHGDGPPRRLKQPLQEI